MAGIVRRELGKPLKTFSVGFDTRLGGNAKFNVDREYAHLAAKFLETDHREMVFADETVMEPELCRLHWYLDQPNYQPTVLAQQLVSRLARKEVKVCLSGDGGDELFGGYSRYKNKLKENMWSTVRSLPNFLLSPPFALMSNIKIPKKT